MTHQPISDNIGSFHPHCSGNLNHCLPHLQKEEKTADGVILEMSHRTVCTILDNPVSRSKIDKVQQHSVQ